MDLFLLLFIWELDMCARAHKKRIQNRERERKGARNGICIYASNDSFTQRNGVAYETIIRITVASYWCMVGVEPFKPLHPTFPHSAFVCVYQPFGNEKTIVVHWMDVVLLFLFNISLHHLSNRRINRGTKVTHDLHTQIETMMKSGSCTAQHSTSMRTCESNEDINDVRLHWTVCTMGFLLLLFFAPDRKQAPAIRAYIYWNSLCH